MLAHSVELIQNLFIYKLYIFFFKYIYLKYICINKTNCVKYNVSNTKTLIMASVQSGGIIKTDVHVIIIALYVSLLSLRLIFTVVKCV